MVEMIVGKLRISKKHTGSGSGNGNIFGRLANAAPNNIAAIILLAAIISIKNVETNKPKKVNNKID